MQYSSRLLRKYLKEINSLRRRFVMSRDNREKCLLPVHRSVEQRKRAGNKIICCDLVYKFIG